MKPKSLEYCGCSINIYRPSEWNCTSSCRQALWLLFQTSMSRHRSWRLSEFFVFYLPTFAQPSEATRIVTGMLMFAWSLPALWEEFGVWWRQHRHCIEFAFRCCPNKIWQVIYLSLFTLVQLTVVIIIFDLQVSEESTFEKALWKCKARRCGIPWTV